MKHYYKQKPIRLKKYSCIFNTYIFLSGIKACYKYDSRVKKIIDETPQGNDFLIGILEHHHAIVVTKLGEELHCRMVIDYIPSGECVEIMFKNIASANLVLANKISFFQAYTQARFVTKGDNRKAMEFVKMCMIVQSYLASVRKKGKYLEERLPLEVSPSLIRSHVFFRGWL